VHSTIFVGMDVHKATISVAVAGGARGGEVRHLGNFLNRADHVGKLVERLSKTGLQLLRFCYEAGPCGYGLHRQITALGHECVVVAPSLIPMKAGDRINTDRRDAVMLAKLHRATGGPSQKLAAALVRPAASPSEGIGPLLRRRSLAGRAGAHPCSTPFG
jgi:transposase